MNSNLLFLIGLLFVVLSVDTLILINILRIEDKSLTDNLTIGFLISGVITILLCARISEEINNSKNN